MEIKDYLVAASIVAGERKIARLEEERSTLCGSADNVQRTNLVPVTMLCHFNEQVKCVLLTTGLQVYKQTIAQFIYFAANTNMSLTKKNYIKS